jgi:archaemetzincin
MRLIVLLSCWLVLLSTAVFLRWMNASSEEDLGEFQQAARLIEPLHQTKGPPAEGEWLAKYGEPGQTFIEYVDLGHHIPTVERRTIYVLPLGEFSVGQDQLIDKTTELLGIFFGVPAKRLPASSIGDVPADARRGSAKEDDEQLLATYLINDVIMPRIPRDAFVGIGLTTFDLWPNDRFNFVFGLAQGDRAVFSLHRFGNLEGTHEEHIQVRDRTFKVALHETGHMLGIPHCKAYECRMNGTNGLAELDRQAMWFCPECEAKVWWGTRINRIERYQSLARFADREGLSSTYEFWRNSANVLQSY